MSSLPFSPIRLALYSPNELLEGFEESEPSSLERTLDVSVFQFFVREGRGTPASPFTGMMEALHDNTIGQALSTFLRGRSKVVGIMGGHKLERGTPRYGQIAELTQALAGKDALVVSGGGPGAMEAAHLGAVFGSAPRTRLKKAIRDLAQAKRSLPDGTGVNLH